MSRYYADIQGNRGQATRMGTAASGMQGHIRSWNLGCQVFCKPDNENAENDSMIVQITSGSTGSGPSITVWDGTRADYERLCKEHRQ